METFSSFYNRKTSEITRQPDFIAFNFEINPASQADIDALYIDTGLELGYGGFSTVYKGRYEGRVVAIKWVVNDDSEESGARQNDLEKEIRLMADLDHDNIVKFFAALVLPGGCAIVMEYGGVYTLESFFDNETLRLDNGTLHLNLETTIKFALAIARAMVYVHATGIIHRDLKPGNLLILGDGTLKLTDFGIAEKADLVHGRVGSWAYMAPEILRGVPGDHNVDVYSFSIILWELLKRDNISRQTSFSRHAGEVLQGRRPTLDGILPDIGSLLERCWANEPSYRPEFNEIEEILNGILEGI